MIKGFVELPKQVYHNGSYYSCPMLFSLDDIARVSECVDDYNYTNIVTKDGKVHTISLRYSQVVGKNNGRTRKEGMTMYDELVALLRKKYDMAPMVMKAADAIEELQEDNAALNGTVSNLIGQIAELRKPNWIPVTERLPGREWVLCKCRANIYEVLSLRDGYWYHDPQHQYMSGFVTHWMPLPEPPKEET